MTLARLDLRQEAQRHTEAVDWIARAAGLGPYAALSEAERQRLLAEQLTSGKVRLDDIPAATASDDVRDVLDTFRVAARLHPESLGAYIITMASAPSDVLAVEFLQMAAGTAHPQRVVPLFETGHDLERAGAVVKELLNIPWYRNRIQGRQEVMIGYSDSAKDTGRLSADWLLYCAQEQVVAACEAAGVHLTLFHGRGGSIGRGGGPTYLAIQSQPPGSIRGTLRATEQGEMLQAKFGLVDIAIRTLEVYTTATLEAAVAPQPAPKQEWRACMDELASQREADVSIGCLRGAAIHTVFQDGHARARIDPDLHWQPAGPPGERRRRRKPARHSMAVCLDADAFDAAVVARHRRCAAGAKRASERDVFRMGVFCVDH